MNNLRNPGFPRRGRSSQFPAALFLAGLAIAVLPAQQPDPASVIQHVDAAAMNRVQKLAGYTVTEHYAVYRGKDETHPASEMMVKTTYRRGVGKSYSILSTSGSEILRKFVLAPLLDDEKTLNLPANVEKSWFISANYEMKLKPGGIQRLDGRDCFALDITPRHKAPNMIQGTLWVDANDGSIVRIEGVASQSPSIFSGSPHMMRQYKKMSGFAMATHARAESNSPFFGRTVLTIDYRDYRLQLGSAN
ncbi:MAG: hypothetical protein ABR956_05410 [Terracidiphilus sp.]